MVPGEVLLVPNFVLLSNLGWIDRYEALIIPWTASIFSIFLLRQFFMKIPKELNYAARVDGCTNFRFLWSIMIPIAKPAISYDYFIESNWIMERILMAIDRNKFKGNENVTCRINKLFNRSRNCV